MMFFSCRLRGFLLLFFFLTFGISPLWASDPSEIEELDFGNCWLQKDEGVIKLASFPENKSKTIEIEEWQQKFSLELSKELKKLGIHQNFSGDYANYLHCSGMGASFMVEILNGAPPLCVRMSMGGVISKLMLSDQAQKGEGPCQGFELGKLVINTEDEKTAVKLFDYLRTLHFQTMINSIYRERKNLFVELKSEYITFEKSAIQELKMDPYIVEINPVIELSPVYFPIGSEVKLFRGAYSLP